MRALLAILAITILAACGSSDSPTEPDGDGDGDVMTATTDGAAFTATNVDVVSAAGGILSFTGNTPLDESPVRIIGIAVRQFTGPGTYDLGPGNVETGATYTVTPSGGTPSQWSTFGAAASGSITVTDYGSGRVAGTFQFVGTADAGTAAAGTLNVTNGTFDISY